MNTERSAVIRFTRRGIARLAYEPSWLPSGGDAPVIMLLHSLLADHSVFADLKARLGERFRTIIPDIRGHGASASIQGRSYSLTDLTADLQVILDAEAVTSAHIVGHEFGGTIAFEFARRHPERVASLALLDPWLYGLVDSHPDPAVHLERGALRDADRAAGDAVYKEQPDRALDLYFGRRFGSNWREGLPRMKLASIRRNAGALASMLPALESYAVDPAAADAIGVPALVLTAEGASPLTRATNAALGAAMSNSECRTIRLGPRLAALLEGEPGDDLASAIEQFTLGVSGSENQDGTD